MCMNKSTWLVIYEQENGQTRAEREKNKEKNKLDTADYHSLEMMLTSKVVPSDNKPSMYTCLS